MPKNNLRHTQERATRNQRSRAEFVDPQVARRSLTLVTHIAKSICVRSLSARKNNTRKECAKDSAFYCGTRPGFWGVRCVICRQKFSKHPLPYGARRALRLYSQAEAQHRVEQDQVEVRLAVPESYWQTETSMGSVRRHGVFMPEWMTGNGVLTKKSRR